ncbi:MAG TPA: queuosine salvage family protein [Solirubrobacteraceae bacterium]|nr:queuosine salvage family protein [Solirubrobacteraceae bacterium]
MVVVQALRQAAAEVAAQAQWVAVDRDQIALYAASLPDAPPLVAPLLSDARERREVTLFWLTLDAINFGSGWFPTLRKRPGRSGYTTVSSGVRHRFDAHGPWSASELAAVDAREIAAALDQDPEHELMGRFAASLNDLGAQLDGDYEGDPLALLEAAGGSAVTLVETLAAWMSFADVSVLDGHELAFLKRAQILAADLARAGAARFDDLAELTMFADNLVPHVLRLDGILSFAPELVERIDAEELIAHGSREEIEIRACALHAVELIVAASPGPVTAAQIDQLLWQRGQGRLYKARPRHRSRCTAY